MKSKDILRFDHIELDLATLLKRVEAKGRASWEDIPNQPGIYVVYLPHGIGFGVRTSTGKAKYSSRTPVPNLRDKWNKINMRASTDILYIGKGKILRKRIRNLARFGVGRARNHKGGEWMWQVISISEAQVIIMTCPLGKEAAFEKWLLEKFMQDHGELPFANRDIGTGQQVWHPPNWSKKENVR